jgi:hypothetical protein
MQTTEDDNVQRHEEAEAVGRMLADAFITRVKKYPPLTRRRLLIACRELLLQDTEVATLLFEARDEPKSASPSMPVDVLL